MARSTKKTTRSVVAALGIIALLAGCTSAAPENNDSDGPSLETMDPIVLTFADVQPPGGFAASAAEKYFEIVTERTNGKVTFEPFWSGALFSPTEALTSVQSGVADISFYSPSYSPQDLPLAMWMLQAGHLADRSFPQNMLEGYASTMVMYRQNEALQAEFAKNGVTPLFMLSSPHMDILCNSEVSSLEQAQGIITRTSSGIASAEVESTGMTTVFAQANELYEGLQRGIMDCVSVNAPYYSDTGLLEVAKYFLPVTLSAQPGVGYLMNSDKFASLPADVQEILMDATVDWEMEYARQQFLKHNAFMEKADELGVEFVDVTGLQPAITKLQEDRYSTLVEEAPVDSASAQAILDEYESLMSEWSNIVVKDMKLPLTSRSTKDVRASFSMKYDEIDWDTYAKALRAALAGSK